MQRLLLVIAQLCKCTPLVLFECLELLHQRRLRLLQFIADTLYLVESLAYVSHILAAAPQRIIKLANLSPYMVGSGEVPKGFNELIPSRHRKITTVLWPGRPTLGE